MDRISLYYSTLKLRTLDINTEEQGEDLRPYLLDAIDKAEAYDIEKHKKSQAGKKSANNLTPEQRKARAIKAVQAREAKRKTNRQ